MRNWAHLIKAIQKEMLEYFSSYFKEVFTANDGKEALEIYKQNRPDVMILDIYMPHLTGIELTKILRENDYKTKIVLITVGTQRIWPADAFTLGH